MELCLIATPPSSPSPSLLSLALSLLYLCVLVFIAHNHSFLVSADMAHALHPSYMDRHDPAMGPKIHGGMVLKHNANQRYATNAVTGFLYREIGRRADLPVQEFAVRGWGRA